MTKHKNTPAFPGVKAGVFCVEKADVYALFSSLSALPRQIFS